MEQGEEEKKVEEEEQKEEKKGKDQERHRHREHQQSTKSFLVPTLKARRSGIWILEASASDKFLPVLCQTAP
eukprot:46460-Pyramimonas_sp.AAC.1